MESSAHHHANGLAGVQSSKCLGDFVVQTPFTDHANEDMVGLAHHLDTLRCHLTQNAVRVWLAVENKVAWRIILPNSKTGTWEGVSHNKVVGNAKLPSKITDLVLEELSQRLNKLQPLTVEHALRKCKVVMGFDSGTGALEGDAISSMLVIISMRSSHRTRQI
jgi:hypothetical protein